MMTNNIPILRGDLALQSFEQEGQTLVAISDPFHYAEVSRVLHANAYNLLVDFAHPMTEEDIRKIFEQSSANPELIEQYLKLVEQLNQDGFMLSEYFVELKTKKDMDYLELENRPPSCAGSSYPAEKEELTARLDELFASIKSKKKVIEGNAGAVIIPHLDFQIGGDLDYTYSSAYESIKNSDADTFIILGTSHSISNDYFMFSEKPYATPLGVAKVDMELISDLAEKLGDYMTIDEIAHKFEHSIEYQVLLLQHYFKKDITILPILCGSLFEELEKDDKEISSVRYNKIIAAIRETVKEKDKKVVFIASADLAHIGRKFGDDFDAGEKLEELSKADNELLEQIKDNGSDAFIKTIFSCQDKWKVCGLSPITAITKLYDFEKADILNYNIWHEIETNSAVSFASVALK